MEQIGTNVNETKGKIIFKNKDNLKDENEKNIEKYIEQLNSLEKIAYEIAKLRLKTSFDIEKCIGYKSFNI
jgi:hypothetical protein